MDCFPRPFHRPFFHRIVVLAILCAGPALARAEERNASFRAALESIRTEELGGYVEHLADEAFEGRESGRRGGRAAGDYLAEQFARLKLAGAGTDGGYFQAFPPNFRNVLAILRGGDPDFGDRVIVVGAHYDHVGHGAQGLSRGPSGCIHPGADDNASGTAALLELAEAFTVLGVPPKRTILFAAWDAEEKGLLGSKHWVARPTVPLDRVAAMLNIDMIGRLRDDRLILYGVRSGFGWRRRLSFLNDHAGMKIEFPWGLQAVADYYPFFNRGIPVLMAHTGLHDDYHRPSDTADRIDREGMTRVTRFLFELLYDLADRSEPTPAYRAAARHESPETEKALFGRSEKPADRLGVGWKEEAQAAGGIRIASVTPGSAADRAKLRPDDRIVRFDGVTIRGDDDFFAAVSAAASPARAVVERPGEPAPLEIAVELEGPPLRWGIAWRLDEAEPNAVVLSYVVPGSPAARAGLAAGDRIYQVDGRDFSDEAAFVRAAQNLPFPISLLVEREGRLRIAVLRARQAEPLRRAA